MLLNLWCDPDVSCVPSGSSPHPDLRGPSVPSSPSCTPNTPTMLCSGNSEPNLNTPLNINLNSSLNSSYYTVFSSSTGLSKCSSLPLFLYLSIFSLSPWIFPVQMFVTHTSLMSFPQVQPQALRSPATQSPLLSHPALARGVMNAPFATRTWWTQSSTPADTCVSATPVASNSRRWPTHAAPSAEGQSKISSRPTGARRLVLDNVLHCQVQLKRL